MGNTVLYLDKLTEGMESLLIEICPKELDLRFLQPSVGKAGTVEEADVIMATVYPVTKEIIDRAGKLKLIHMPGAGFNHIDTRAATEHGVYVSNSAGENASTTAEMAIALMLCCYRRVAMVDRRVKQGEWHTFTYRHDSYELRGKTVGVVGSGACGKNVMQRLAGWNVKILYSDPYRMKEEDEKMLNAEYTDLDTLFRESDIVSLHCPLTNDTRGMVNKDRLKTMKKNAIIINEARGAVINEPDLIEALNDGVIWGAGLDCWEKEPLDPDDPLLKMEKVITTSHLGGSTREAMCRCFGKGFDNAVKVIKGERPDGIVNGL